MPVLRALRCKMFFALLLVSTLTMPPAALAHHSFTMFDMTKRITLVGSVTSFEWTNPHSYIEIDVPDDQSAANAGGASTGTKHWSIEMGSPSILLQSGWKFNGLKKGDKTTLIINPLKNGKAGGFLVQATLPDGRMLGNGPAQNPQ
jgi:hypothetical protein